MRQVTAAPCDYLDFGHFARDLNGRLVIDASGRAVALRRREFDLLLALSRSPGRVMSRATLLDAIANREAEAFDRTIDVHMGRLRRKIEPDPAQPRMIITIPGVGYRLTANPRPLQVPDQTKARQHPYGEPVSAGLGILAAFNRANLTRDVGELASLYAKDAVYIASGKPLLGRAAIEQWFVCNHDYVVYSPDPSRLEQLTVSANNVMVRRGTWSGTCLGENGPHRVIGHWATTDVRDGLIWKIHMETTWRT
jgi:DNA-binding winged helix-turn-helix (wHTH) protein